MGIHCGAVLQSGQAGAMPETPARLSASGDACDSGRAVTPAAVRARHLAPCSPDTFSEHEDGSDVSVDVVALSQSPGSSVEVVELSQASDSGATAAESLRLAQEAGDRGADEPEAPCLNHQDQNQEHRQCSMPATQSVNGHAQDCSVGYPSLCNVIKVCVRDFTWGFLAYMPALPLSPHINWHSRQREAHSFPAQFYDAGLCRRWAPLLEEWLCRWSCGKMTSPQSAIGSSVTS